MKIRPPKSRLETVKLMQDISIWNQYHSLAGIIGIRLGILINYLQQTDQIDKNGERTDGRV